MRASILIACGVALLAVTGARADTIVLKSGARYETDKCFKSAGAYYFNQNGSMTSVAESDVARVEKAGATPAPAQIAQAQQPVKPQKSQAELEQEFMENCRFAIDAEARKTKSDFKAKCAKAVQMVERMQDGSEMTDATFGYYLDALQNPLMWDILPAEQSAKLKSIVFRKDGAVDQYLKGYNERLKVAKFGQNFALAKAAEAHEAEVRQQEAEYKSNQKFMTKMSNNDARARSARSAALAKAASPTGRSGSGGRAAAAGRASSSGCST